MSYLDAISKIHTLEENGGYIEDYDYFDYLNDMTIAETSMYREINKIADEVSIEAIHALTEGVTVDGEKTKNSKKYAESVKNDTVNTYKDKSINQIMAIYKKANVVIKNASNFITTNKRDIENTTISSNYEHYNGKCKKVDDVKFLDDITVRFKPSTDFKSVKNKSFTADTINKKKEIMMKNISIIDSSLEKVKSQYINKIENMSSESIKSEEYTAIVKEFEGYCKYGSLFIMDTVAALNLFVSNKFDKK